jgi:hypothetical protein
MLFMADDRKFMPLGELDAPHRHQCPVNAWMI